jgi:hypothetical protein
MIARQCQYACSGEFAARFHASPLAMLIDRFMTVAMTTASELAREGTLRAARREAARTALLNATAEILSEATQIEASLSEISRRSGSIPQ